MANHDHEAERMVLSAVIGASDLSAWEMARTVVGSEHFHLPAHRRIWEACERAAVTKPIALDSQLVVGELGTKYEAEYLEATRKLSTPRMLPDYLRRVRDLATVRDIMQACGELYAEAKEGPENVQDFLDNADRRVTDALKGRMASKPGRSLGHYVDVFMREMAESAQRGGRLGRSTGLRALDTILGGLCPGEVVVIAGRPGMGKSALVQKFVRTVAGAGDPVLLFSLEMPGSQYAGRMLASESSQDFHDLRTGQALRHGPQAIVEAGERLNRLPVQVEDVTRIDHSGLAAQARAYAREVGQIGMIGIDYLQLMSGRGDEHSREREVAEASRACKMLAKELACPVVLLSQLNREVDKRSDRRPLLSDLRESGAIEQDADSVVFVYREDVFATGGEAELIVAKQRNGRCAIAKVAWVGRKVSFENLHDGAEHGRQWE